MKEVRKLLVVLLAAVFFIGLFVFCDRFAEDVRDEYASQINPSIVGKKTGNTSGGQTTSAEDLSVEKMVQDMITRDYSASVTLSAAGDILCQRSQLERAYDEESGEFDFTESFDHVRDLFQSSDYTVATLKTTMAGKYKGNSDEFYGYSTANALYNSPEILADNIKDAGISLVNMATNHSLDSDEDGLKATIGYLDAAGLAHVGAAVSNEESTDYSANVNGIQIGFIGYTNLTNGLSLGADAACVLNTLNDYDSTKIESLCGRVLAMKNENDLVVVMLNFGSIESDTAETEQRTLAEQLCRAGADLILGTGSRVLKPVEQVTVTDETTGETKKCLVLYGMGALLSAETYSSSGKDTDISAVFDFDIVRNEFGETYIRSFSVIPVYLNWYDNKIQPVSVCEAKDTSKYADELDAEDMERINSAYENTVPRILEGSGLTSEYRDYAFLVQLQ